MPDPVNNNSSPKFALARSKVGKNKQYSELEQGKFLLELYQKALLLSQKELHDYFLDHAVALTGSTIGFFHFISDDQKFIILTAWNGEALKNCTASYNTHYPIELAGNWVDCVRLKKPVIYNDFAKSPNQKGFPSGHVLIKRFMSIPILEKGKVVIVFGVGNKTDPYNEDDVVQLQLIANEFSKIYKQRQAEYTIHESEEKYRALVETADDVILLTDLNGHQIFRNKAYFTSLGYEVGEEIDRDGFASVHPDDLPVLKAKQTELLKQGSISSEYSVRHKNGSWVYRFAKSTVIYDQAHKPKAIMAIIRDITERKKTEEKLEEYRKNLEKLVEERTMQLKDAERLAAIGATAGMVGHDIRNPLQAITSDVFLVRSELVSMPEGEEKNNIKESLEGIEKNIDYINKIVADLQDFARPLKPHAEEADLKIILNDLLSKNNLPKHIKVTVKVDSEARKVVADCAYLTRIMNNLITNAFQAMSSGGKLTIQASKEKDDVVITVKDTGVGVPEKVKNKLFTPMFTTKSKGQGFGLPVVKRMTEALGGTVTFESQEGEGTTFIVRLPPPRNKR